MFFGNLVNTIFDKLLIDKEIEFDEIIEHGFKQRILSGIIIYKKYNWKSIKRKLKTHFENLSIFISDLKHKKVIIEPSFISNQYGIQGRLDALFLYNNNEENFYEIVELKSSKSPHIEYIPFEEENENRGVWINHLIQIVTYKLLLESFIKLENGKTQLLYSSDREYPFRSVEDDFILRKKILSTRNYIVAIEKAIANRKYDLLDKLNTKDLGALPSFQAKKSINFTNIYNNLNEFEKEYFHEALTFLNKNILHQNIFYNVNENYSDVIENLKINEENSDFEKNYIVFNIQKNISTSFRIGDQIILIYNNQNDGLIHKGYIKLLNLDSIVISLRNKLTIEEFFKSGTKWKIIKDESNALIKKIYPLLLNLFENQKKDILFGIVTSNERNEIKYKNNELTANQNFIIQNALSAENYYLIQGPPGSGKTSRILKSLVEYYYKNKTKTIVFSFTNKSVDHIEEVLKTSGIRNYIRIGTKVNESENLLAKITEENSFNEIIDKLDTCNLFISTISSLISNQEIFELYDFDIAIVDEASQILELDSISILQKFKKFIMIGDEKQLPAVCSLDEAERKIESKLLNDKFIYDFGESLFSRLIKININQKTNNFGLLYEQGRMDDIIMDITNSLFYNGLLKRFENNNNDFKFQSNIYFVNNVGNQLKKDDFEAKLTLDLINYFSEKGIEAQQIGVISPFRLQCRNILNKLEYNYEKEIQVETIERFQGSEKDIIIFSLSTNFDYLINQISSIELINDIKVDRKLNVAITRAKKILIIIGNEQILNKSEIYYKLITYFKEKNKFLNLSEFENNFTHYLPENNL